MKINCKEVPHATDNSFTVAEQVTFKEATEYLKEDGEYLFCGSYDSEDGFDNELQSVDDLGQLFVADDERKDFFIIRHFERKED